MSFETNRPAGTFIRIAATLVLAACFSPCSLPGQEQEGETPPPPSLTRTHDGWRFVPDVCLTENPSNWLSNR
jgi:hypothetical protein